MTELDRIEAEYWELMEDYNASEDFDYLARLMKELLNLAKELEEKAWKYEDTSK
jgi:hypothetical protein